jgi:hypothetical protein
MAANTYRPASTLALLTVLLFLASSIFESVAALVTTMQIYLLESLQFGQTLTPVQAEVYDHRQRLLAVIELALNLPAMVLFLAWVYRANRNARALGEMEMRYGPGWSVACFFIPIVNLYAPYLAIGDIWRASRVESGREPRSPASALVGSWWVIWLVGSCIQFSRMGSLLDRDQLAVLSRFPYGEAGGLTELGKGWVKHLLELSWWLMIRDVVWIAGGILALAVVIRITDMQERKRAALERINDLPRREELRECLPTATNR